MIKRIILGFFVSIGVLVMLLIIGAIIGMHYVKLPFNNVEMPKHAILNIHINDESILETAKNPLLSLINPDEISFFDLRTALQAAKSDDRIDRIHLVIQGNGLGIAQIQELRRWLKDVKKPIHVFADTFGEMNNATLSYYLAAAGTRIYLQPGGSLNIFGLMFQGPFLKGILDILGVKAQFFSREAYKGITQMFTNSDYSPEVRKNLGAMLQHMLTKIQKDIAKDRKIDLVTVQQYFDKGYFNAEEALKLNLVDGLKYLSESAAKNKISLGFYLKNLPKKTKFSNQFSLITIEGMIDRNDEDFGLIGGGYDSIAESIITAGNDPNIKAIILRINSGGGSPVGSLTIRNAVEIAKKKKPVVVSMGDAAASGGYLIACAADKIVAQHTTITGSIGVALGKLSFKDVLNRVGINFGQIKSNDNASIPGMYNEFSPEQQEIMNKMSDDIYNDFLEKVSQGRNIPAEKVRAIAQGKVYSGKTALELGLVDNLGGVDEAVLLARKLANLGAADVTLVPYTSNNFLAQFKQSFRRGIHSFFYAAVTPKIS